MRRDPYKIQVALDEECERNGCDLLATDLVIFHRYTGGIKACHAHAMWYKANTIATKIMPLGPMTIGEVAAARNS